MCFVFRVCNHCNTGSCARVYVCVCVCVCVRVPHTGLSDTSALEISSGGGSRLNSLRAGVRTLRSPALRASDQGAFPKRESLCSVSFPIQRTRVTRVTRDVITTFVVILTLGYCCYSMNATWTEHSKILHLA